MKLKFGVLLSVFIQVTLYIFSRLMGEQSVSSTLHQSGALFMWRQRKTLPTKKNFPRYKSFARGVSVLSGWAARGSRRFDWVAASDRPGLCARAAARCARPSSCHVTGRKRNASRTARSAFGTTCLTGVFFIIHRRSADCNQPDAEGEPEEVLQGERNHLFWVVGTRAPQRSWRHLRVGLWSKMILVELMICWCINNCLPKDWDLRWPQCSSWWRCSFHTDICWGC